jgi:hypothetical protein
MSSDNNMVERVARAICSYPFDLYDQIKDDPNEVTDQGLLLKQMDGWRVMARGAIEAMRLPTDEMCDAAGCEAIGVTHAHAFVVWLDMIDEALK